MYLAKGTSAIVLPLLCVGMKKLAVTNYKDKPSYFRRLILR